MLGFFKNLLRKPLVFTAGRKSISSVEEREAPEAGRPYAAQSGPGAAQPRRSAVPSNGRGVELSLQGILNTLPLELQPKVRVSDVGDMTITVPLEKVLAQLSRGAVKISFGELRQAVPDVFTEENDRDRVLVSLPLNEILGRLNPALIARRRVQRQVQVPAEVASPFDTQGQGLVFQVGPGNGNSAPPPSTPSAPTRQHSHNTQFTKHAAPTPSHTPARSTLTSAPTPAAPSLTPAPTGQTRFHAKPKPVAAPGLAKPVAAPAAKAPPAPPVIKMSPVAAPSAPAPAAHPSPAPAPATPAPAAPQFEDELPPAPFAFSPPTPPTPARPSPMPVRVEPVKAEARKMPEIRPAAPAASVPQPAAMPHAGEVLVIALTSLADAWPEAIRKEIVDMSLVDAKVALPAHAVEQALKQGKIAFSWKMLRSWIRPMVLPSVSAHDGAVLELPLKVVAPQFLALQRKTAKPQQKVAIDDEIPNLFFGFPQPDAAPSQATASPADTNYYVWDDSNDTAKVDLSDVKRGPGPGTRFVSKYATPNEVVSRAAAVDGVAGVLIALPDGLMVANKLPADVNAETIAAFLPQIFGKVSQCTKELRMGELNNLNFTVGNVPWKIFRVNAIFFAAFGRAGEPLPTAQLAALAAELDHKAK